VQRDNYLAEGVTAPPPFTTMPIQGTGRCVSELNEKSRMLRPLDLFQTGSTQSISVMYARLRLYSSTLYLTYTSIRWVFPKGLGHIGHESIDQGYALSKGRIVQGMEHLRLFVRRHIGRGRKIIAPSPTTTLLYFLVHLLIKFGTATKISITQRLCHLM
jgi:hypothetical protein